MPRLTIVDQSALDPVPNVTGRHGPPLGDAIIETSGWLCVCQRIAPGTAAHLAARLRLRVLRDLHIWRELGHGWHETVRRTQQDRRNAARDTLWRAIGGPERLAEYRAREREKEKVA